MSNYTMSHLTASTSATVFRERGARLADRVRDNRRMILMVVVIAAMAAYFIPFLILGSNAYITIHDNLDGGFVISYLLVKTGKALTFDGRAVMENIMNGLPRTALSSGLNVPILLFYIFPPAWAYIINFILVHIIGFCGMFLLLRKHFLTKSSDYLLAGAISLCFFLVPYYAALGLTVAGQPLLTYAFLNIRSGGYSWRDYFIILLFPLWSEFALIAPFAVTALGIILICDWLKSHRLNKRLSASALMFFAAYMVLQFQLINSILGSNKWVSHRSTWNRWTDFNLSSNIKSTLELLLATQYHTGSYWTLPILVAILGALGFLIAGKRQAGILDAIAVGIMLICLEYGFYAWLARWFGWLFPGSQAFNGGRYYFLLPLLWLLAFALSLKEFMRWRSGIPLAWCLIVLQVFAILKFNTEYKNNVRLLLGRHTYEPSFNRFFASDLFADIDSFIGRPKSSYRVVTVGMYPSVAQFNGFYTLDAYLTNYPLEYKQEFRRIIARELDKDPQLKEYFDGWGNRCYIFSSELRQYYLFSAESRKTVHDLELDTAQLRAMGGEYVISAVDIDDSAQRGLRLEREFFSPGSFWHIYLYYVVPQPTNGAVNGSKDLRRDTTGRAGS